MKKRTLIAACLLAAMSANAQSQVSGIDKKNMNLNVKPGTDFYQYAAGGWLKSHPLDAEHTNNGAFTDLYEENQKRIQELILEYASKPQKKGTLEQKIGTFYNMLMDSVRLNREGWEPLKPTLARIAAVKSNKEYQLVTAELDRRGEGTMMFGIGVGADMRNASMNIVAIGQGGLGLGTRDYYLNEDPQTVKVREAYKTYMKNLFKMVGNDEATAAKKVEAIMAIETRIAKVSYSNVQLRDIDKNYHKMSYNDLVLNFPGIDWGNVFLQSGFPPFDAVDVGQPEPIHEVEKILADTKLDDLKAYAEIKVISGATSQLSDAFRAESFKFSSVLSGAQQDRPRWKRAVATVSGVFGEAIGKLYVAKYFPESSKQHMIRLVKNLQEALGQRIQEATWMSAATKAQAKDKLDNFIVKIGYPDKWRDYSGLQIDDKLSLYANMQNINEFLLQDELNRKVNKPVDKMEWGMTPQTINAYYNPTTNEICFPAAILQPPFFDPNADDAVNYGGIGAVIGHEMSHGFDDQGSQFDKTGNQRDWWTAQDKKNFQERSKVLVDHFGKVEVVNGKKVNGQLTLGENIGDNGGLNIAFRALQNSMKKKPLKTLDGFTPEQRFFLSWARVWAGNARPEYLEYLITVDPHSPNMARVNAALPEIDAWYDAFKIKKGDKLFIPANKRAHIW
ncbi:MAG: M13 family metallopeptidase [Prevotella nigrescens]|jgi:peptidase family M13|uniref:M13 family metallopeptidase n=1 Tax=Prevotella nigrescens TaxID=28133 RepID=A0A9D5X0C3_9BACT|nr:MULTISPECIES: M13 family metallopeptidase [Prevotella]MBF1444270.1 M13 family metallopeptidase [Prevotella nigrescens]MBF1447012.1 M13 family metallopeptidase [Prevotella nigrescens]MBF1452412.1 M13 family metallopeptidase [Prevotella nigrescens]OWP29707.1 peptidase M13 [Prevotella nigrescens]QUB52180.1 M13 family metallopeptidase [Prevotella nigrescens]